MKLKQNAVNFRLILTSAFSVLCCFWMIPSFSFSSFFWYVNFLFRPLESRSQRFVLNQSVVYWISVFAQHCKQRTNNSPNSLVTLDFTRTLTCHLNVAASRDIKGTEKLWFWSQSVWTLGFSFSTEKFIVQALDT